MREDVEPLVVGETVTLYGTQGWSLDLKPLRKGRVHRVMKRFVEIDFDGKMRKFYPIHENSFSAGDSYPRASTSFRPSDHILRWKPEHDEAIERYRMLNNTEHDTSKYAMAMFEHGAIDDARRLYQLLLAGKAIHKHKRHEAS